MGEIGDGEVWRVGGIRVVMIKTQENQAKTNF